MKLRRLDLYEDWLCPVCDTDKETFNHVWICSKHVSTLTLMTIPLKQELNNIIREHTNTALLNQFYEDDNIWDIIISNNSFTFIDLIKGIVPTSLTTYINSFVKSQSLTLSVLDQFYFILQGVVREMIWNRRCDKMIQKEAALGITKREKRKPNTSPTRNYNRSYNIDRNSLKLDIPNYGFVMQCILGIKNLNFMSIVNHPLKTCWSFASFHYAL